MKIIFKIAKNELRNLVFSPVAWFVAIVFFIQCAYFYFASIYGDVVLQDQLIQNVPAWKDFAAALTKAEFLKGDGLFGNAYQNLYLFVPLLTMGVMSREINSGTIKLLYSSPIRLREIVLGKYLAIMIYNLVLVAIVGVFAVIGMCNIKSPDIGLLLSAEFGFYILVCALSAIGLFMSSLSTYQVVSGIGTFIIIFILGRIGTLWQNYDFIRDLTYFLSTAGRTEKMLNGLITTKDVIYFLVVIFMFLSFTLLKLKGEREFKPWPVKAARYISVVIVSVIIGYITSRPAMVAYWDTTALKINTIHPRTQAIIKKMGDEPFTVTMYTNLFNASSLKSGLPQVRNLYLSVLWDRYLRFKPNIRFKYVYYYYSDGRLDDSIYYKQFPHKTEQQIAGIIAKMNQTDVSMFMGAKEIRKIMNPNHENGRLYLSVEYKGRKANLRTFEDTQFWPNESQVAAVLKRLVEVNTPKVYFTTGNLERDIYKTGEREYSRQSTDKNYRESLINMGFDPDTISLEKRDIPANTATLVIADPKTELSPVTLTRVKNYVDKGGNMLVFGEPRKQTVINPVLKQLGVQMDEGTLVQLSKDETPDKIITYGTTDLYNLAEENTLIGYKSERDQKIYKDTLTGMMPGAAPLSYNNNGPFKIAPLLKTFKWKTWLKKGMLVIDSVPPIFSPEEGDVKVPSFDVAVKLTRQMEGKQQRIIVCGDADFRNNIRIFSDGTINAFYSWLNNSVYPVYLPAGDPQDNRFTVTALGVDILRVIFVWVMPGILILAGVILLIRRKRK
jgi:ABC-2 type transport system permease protein